MVRRAMTQTRELARGLSPVRLEAEGLTDALRELAAGTRKVFGCDCRCRCDPPVLVPDHTVAIHFPGGVHRDGGTAAPGGRKNQMKPTNSRRAVKARKRILILDDHPITRYGLTQLINHEPDLLVCGDAESVQQALA